MAMPDLHPEFELVYIISAHALIFLRRNFPFIHIKTMSETKDGINVRQC